MFQTAAVRVGKSGEFPAGDTLAHILGLAHFPLLVGAVYTVSGAGDHTVLERALAFLAAGVFFGQISNANAHELIHSTARWPRRLGTMIYISLLFGHHASAHKLVHHVWVATERDPNSAKLGQSFYNFWPRAWGGSFVAGWHAENALRERSNSPDPFIKHPYFAYVIGAVLCLAVVALAFGWPGVLACSLLAIYAQMQLLVSDYVQHYGLRRTTSANGKFEPVSQAHSWNSSQFCTSAMMMNAPRHSDHHMNPRRPYPALQLDRSFMPILPRSLPVMGVYALVPPLWRRLMDGRVAAHCPSRE
ncbi:alkane 1-monooxygenase [Shimia abyssi]|nr:alkane 1-monooxygenase [Shimia abyssi]